MDGRPVVVAALLVFAGCAGVSFGGGGAETPRETLTPVPVSPTEESVATSPPVERPPGVSRGGIVDARRLRDAHESFVSDRSYRWRLVYALDGPEQAGTAFERGFTRRAVVEPGRFLVRQVEDDRPLNQSLFVDDTGGYLRTVEGNATRNETLADPGQREDYVPGGQLIERFLAGLDPNVTRVERAGTTYYRLHARAGVPPTIRQTGATVSNYSVTAYVTPEGFVRSMTVTFERSWNAREERVYVRFYYDRVGSANVERPRWVDDLSLATPTPTVAPTTASGRTTGAATPTPTLTTAEDATGN